MSRHFSRTATTLTLIASLWASSLAVAAAPQTSQQTTTPKTAPQTPSNVPQQTPPTVPSQPVSRDADKQGTAKPEAAKKDDKKQKTATPVSNKPLSEKEDPRKIGTRNINKGIIAKMSGSLEKEVAQGRQIAAEVDKQAKFVDDPVVTEYINRVGQNVVLHSDAKIPFTIKVVDVDEANAFALPGGFFYVNKGLILAADNEAELAGVMAHEIAHVTARHSVEAQTKGMLADLALTAGSIFLGGIGGALILNGAQMGALAGFMKFNRDAESEADRLGAQYLYAAGYDPGSMSTMFEKLLAKNKKKPGFLSKMFATHPQTADRMEASRQLVARFPDREEYILSTSEFQRVKARLLRLSNARTSVVGDITAGADGAPGRPTLKRRQPPPDPSADTTTTTPPVEQKAEPPVLKRRDTTPPPPATQPGTTTPTTTNP